MKTDFAPTDSGNAERLVALYKDQLRHCPALGWLVWDKEAGFWRPDAERRVLLMARDAARALRHAAEKHAAHVESQASTMTPTVLDASRAAAEKHRRWALRAESRTALENAIALASPDKNIRIDVAELDGNPWLLTVKNGTLDLKTGILGPHDPAHYITKQVPVAYDAKAECPLFMKFLERVLPDDLLRAYVQRALGYSLTGRTNEQVFFMPYGTGGNGKTTLLETFHALMGPHSRVCSTDVLLVRKTTDNNTLYALAALKGSRFVRASETEAGQTLRESLVKLITGEETISARWPHGAPFEYRPQFKLWLSVNDRPVIKGQEHAIWRRIHIVPFEVKITPEEKDDKLGDKLCAEELPGIFRWAVQGCLAWQEHGLNPPAGVQAANADYKTAMDSVARFLAEETVKDPTGVVEATMLYTAYTIWCHENDVHSVANQHRFGKQMPFEKDRNAAGRTVYYGVRFKKVGEPSEPSEAVSKTFPGELL